MSIINIGASANDGTGDPLRSAFRKINTFHSVISRTASVPGSPTVGDLYIVPSGATGAWSGQGNKFAWFNGTSWEFYSPTEGVEVWVRDTDEKWRFVTNWNVIPAGQDLTLVGVNNVHFHVASNAAQSINNTTITIAFGNIVSDSNSLWDSANNRTAAIPSSLNGKRALFVAGMAHTTDGTANLEYLIEVSTNGGSSWSTVTIAGLQGEQFGLMQVTGIVTLATGNLYRIRHFCSASKTIRGDGLVYLRMVVLDSANGNDSKPVRSSSSSTTLAVGDTNGVVVMNSGSANTLTIPPESSVDIAVGSEIVVIQRGTGTTTIQAGTGVSLRGVSEGSCTMSGAWAETTLRKIAPDLWTINGEHGAVS